MEQLLRSYGATPTERHTGDDWRTDSNNWLRMSPLHEAARKGDVSGARTLLQAGADLTARGDHIQSTPLAWAAKFGQLEMVKFLLQHGAPKRVPDDPEWATPLAWAIRRGTRRSHGCSRSRRVRPWYNSFSYLILGSSMAEHPAVNRRVAGSSPARGASH